MASHEALAWRSAASPLVCSSSSSSSASSLLRVRLADRRSSAGLVLLEWRCAACPSSAHSKWLDASAVTLVRHAGCDADALLGRGAHEPPFEDDNDSQLRLYESPRLGRVVAAHQTIPVGACALRATAFAVVVSDRAAARHCHWCFAQLTKKAFRCGACEFALYCSRACLEADAVLHDPQCETLRALHQAPWASSAWAVDKETVRLALAVLTMEVFVANPHALAKLTVPEASSSSTAALDQAVAWLRRSLKKISTAESALRAITRAHIRETLRRIQSNAHPLLLNGTSGVCGIGVFPEAAMTLNHSCTPNVVPSFDPKTRSLQLHAVADIQPMELLEYSYLSDLTVGRARRQETLRDGFGFDCECQRCVVEATDTLEVAGASHEEQELLRQLVELSGENDPLAVSGKLQLLETRHAVLLRSRADVAFSLKMLALHSATQTKDWTNALSLAETLLTLWEAQGLPKWYPTTETLHQQIAVAAMRLGDGARAQEARARVAEIQKVCGFVATP